MSSTRSSEGSSEPCGLCRESTNGTPSSRLLLAKQQKYLSQRQSSEYSLLAWASTDSNPLFSLLQKGPVKIQVQMDPSVSPALY